MLQRIQTVFLFLAMLVSAGLIFIFPLWFSGNAVITAMDTISNSNIFIKPIGVLFIISAILSFTAIFQYNNRKFQMTLVRLDILINFLLLGLIVYQVQNLSGEALVSEKGIGSFLPIVVIFLLVFANRYIKKDEDLVKSVDRLR
ncbi:MAG TPA: DUF4293 family protein [Flavobacteriia bacterium]|nr:DUF4293 family protein [Flavobacteriia bacterium]